jgi:hypothetical protein
LRGRKNSYQRRIIIEGRESKWELSKRTLHILITLDSYTFVRNSSMILELDKRHVETGISRQLNTLKGHVELVVHSKGLNNNAIQQEYNS